ncbi:MAG: DUF4412 domain-containing protein [Mucilaginibacter sp.]|uniref:DUF4412 domain-containing protein n=1 Tax=Mucilaginibacter sp. TaxID=1882438 RepID=UPI003266A67D
MKRNILFAFAIAISLYSCSGKKTEGSIYYTVEYQLPDSLKEYAEHLPKQAMVYFKGDSTVSIQAGKEESTSIVTNQKTTFMRALLKSDEQKKYYAIDYDKNGQAEELASMPSYTFTKTTEHKSIAGYEAYKYNLKEKLTGDEAEAWFTKDVAIIPNSLTLNLDTALGVPLSFTSKQNGIIVKTTAKDIKFEKVPDGVFNTPKGYEFLTPQQFKNMTSGN